MKKGIIKIATFLIDLTSSLVHRLSGSPQSTKFKSLAPTSDIENGEIYHQALSWALSNREIQDIKNIAITGYYGSGKSSVIKNFVKHYQHSYKFLPISLATFKDDDNLGVDRNPKDHIKEIEESILQQIFYNVPDHIIPNSRFSKIAYNFFPKYFFFSSTIVLFLLFVVLHLYPSIKETLEWNLSSQFIAYGLLISGATTIYLIFWKLKNLTLSKLSVKNLEVDLAEENEDLSVLNRYIDEIIYFFKETKYQVVIIEDIDRFETTEIFTKLREINLILNNSEITKDLHVVFLYAIKDDQFQNKKDRTKFFDFIIPVIPVINFSNSVDKLLSIKEEYNLDVSEKLIKELAVYIDDMRLLLNIFNEFLIYDAKIKDVSRDKIFAIIIYKNLLPDDFALLAQNKGLLFSLFDKKQDILEEKINSLEEKIEEKISENEILSDHTIADIRELRSLYLLKYIESLENQATFDFRSFYLHGMKRSLADMTSDENFEALTRNKVQYTFGNNNAVRSFSIQFETVEKKVDLNRTYFEREKLIQDKLAGQESLNNRKISEFRNEIDESRKLPLHDLLSKSTIKTTLKKYLLSVENDLTEEEVGDILDQKLLLIQSLILNGHIDEDYLMYISIFYEERMKRTDFQFIQSVKNQKKLDYNYRLKNVKEIIGFLNPGNLESEYVYNSYLTSFLLEHKKYSQERDLLFDAISCCSEAALNYILYLIDHSDDVKELIQEISKRNPKIWDEILSSKASEENIQKLYQLLLEHNKAETLIKMINLSNFDRQILTDGNFLIRTEVEKLQEIISKARLQLRQIDFPQAPKKLLDFIYENNHYDFSENIIDGFYRYKVKNGKNDFKKRIFSIISKAPELDNMFDYIQGDINKYVLNIPLQVAQNDSEEEEPYVYLLNDENLTIENKVALIQKMSTVVSKAEDIENSDTLQLLVKELRISPTWENIDYCTKAFSDSAPILKLPKQLAEFMSHIGVSQVLKNQELDGESMLNENLEILIFNRVDILNERYEELITNFSSYQSMDFKGLNDEKIKIIINKGKLELSHENVVGLRSHNPDLIIVLLEKWKDIYIKEAENYPLKEKELKSVLQSSKFTASEKSEILKDQNAISYGEDPELLELIANLIIDEDEFYAPTDVIFKLIDIPIRVDKSIKLFNKIAWKLSNDQIRIFLSNLKEPFNALAEENSRPLIPKDEETTRMLEILEEKAVISSKKIEGQKYRVYRYSTVEE